MNLNLDIQEVDFGAHGLKWATITSFDSRVRVTSDNSVCPNMWRGAYTLSLPFGGGISLDKWSVYAPFQGISKMICPNFSVEVPIKREKSKIRGEWPLVHVGLGIEEYSACLTIGYKLHISPNLSLTRYDWRDTGQRKFAKMGGHYFYTTEVIKPWRVAELFSISDKDWLNGVYEPSIITRTRTHTRGRFHGPSWEFKHGAFK